MSKPAARLTDMHVCPMVTPGVPPVPHVGGPITGPGMPTVLIGGMPAATMGDMATCVGPPDTIAMGSAGVMIGGKPAARMGDLCSHGGTIAVGFPTVLIGEVGAAVVTPSAGAAMAGGAPGCPSGGGAGASAGAAAVRPPVGATATGAAAGAAAGQPQKKSEKKDWFKAKLIDSDGEPMAGVKYEIELPDGTKRTGRSDNNGMVKIAGIDPGNCTLNLVDVDDSGWEPE